MAKVKHGFIIGLLFVLLWAIGSIGLAYVQTTTHHKKKLASSNMVPLIFVPGSSATKERFNDMIDDINRLGPKHNVLKLTVSKNNNITYEGHINHNERRPLIVIAFENNQDGYQNIKKQAYWLNTAMDALQQQYQFQTFDAIGHSNGGLNWTIFLEEYDTANHFKMNHLVTMGTPYNFEETNPANQTQLLKDLIAQNSKLPSDLVVYNIAGTNTYEADKIVPIQSVQAGKYIFQKVVKHYTQVTVTGDQADHSGLPSNLEVIDYVIDKLILKGRSADLLPASTE
ncbi:alpha/beta hydrolase [Streptococcus halichoeri]|uniref:alpha/beta hydrolase n=1 Tax=Streptococcus halichoeri TaxID=254785 RepID=UPI00135950C1|nr:alpha/beta hydrolase [Streptococcus halichoeri]